MVGILYLIYYFAITLWYVFLIAGGLLLFLAKRWSLGTTSLSGKIGSGILIFSAVLILILGLYGAYVYLDNQVFYKWRAELKDRRLDRTQNTLLDKDLDLTSLTLPKGTRVRWSNRFDIKKKEQATIKDIWWINLGQSTEFFGFVFDKDWSVYIREETIKGHLLDVQYIGDLPVYGEIVLSKEGKPIQAKIAQNTTFKGKKIVQNSTVFFESGDNSKKKYIRIVHPEGRDSEFTVDLKIDEE